MVILEINSKNHSVLLNCSQVSNNLKNPLQNEGQCPSTLSHWNPFIHTTSREEQCGAYVYKKCEFLCYTLDPNSSICNITHGTKFIFKFRTSDFNSSI